MQSIILKFLLFYFFNEILHVWSSDCEIYKNCLEHRVLKSSYIFHKLRLRNSTLKKCYLAKVYFECFTHMKSWFGAQKVQLSGLRQWSKARFSVFKMVLDRMTRLQTMVLNVNVYGIQNTKKNSIFYWTRWLYCVLSAPFQPYVIVK